MGDEAGCANTDWRTSIEEPWGPFGQSWKLTYFSAHLIEPQYQTLIGFPLAWTPGTSGDIKVEPVMAVINTEADFDKFKGKLKDKVVLSMEFRKVLAHVHRTAGQAAIPTKNWPHARKCWTLLSLMRGL